MTDDLTLNMDAYLPLRDVVFNTLREAILKGELKPGERLMELQLAAKLGVVLNTDSFVLNDNTGASLFELFGQFADKLFLLFENCCTRHIIHLLLRI